MTEKYHRVPFHEGEFIGETVADISADKGIKASVGKLKGDESGELHIREYLFDVEKWSALEADKWVADHKKKAGIERRSYDSVIGYSKEDRGEVKLRGKAIPYNELSDNPVPGFGNVKERILPGAFNRSLESGRDVMMLWNHELKYIFGRTSRGTLSLHEMNDGVHFENIPPESNWAKDLLPSIKRGDYANMSFGFKEDRGEFTKENGEIVRNVREATLYEISLVPFAVYETTSIGMRSAGLLIIDGIVLADPVVEHQKQIQELDQFKEIEDQFNKLKEYWIK